MNNANYFGIRMFDFEFICLNYDLVYFRIDKIRFLNV